MNQEDKLPKVIRLFDDKDFLNEDGKSFRHQLDLALMPIIDNWIGEGYSHQDMANLLQQANTNVLLAAILRRQKIIESSDRSTP